MAAKRVHHTIHWFRKGLRLHDNPALREAYDTSLTVRPVYILDPDLVKCGQIGVVRWRFILQSLEDLDQSLRQINSRLLVIQGRPSEVFADLFKKWEITKLTFEVDTDALAKARDEEVIKLASQANVEVVQKVSHTLFDLDAILAKNLGTAPLTYKSFQAVVSTLGAPDEPLPAVDRYITHGCKLPIDDEHDRYSIPTIDDLGLSIPEESSEVLYPGGEVEALRRMNEYMAKQDWVCKFEKPSTSPNSIEPSTTVLSPYLALGCLSVRLFYKKIQEIYSKAKKHSQPPVSLHGQLLWREFFSTCAHNTPNFNKMEGNRVCLQIPWDKNDDHLKAWSTGCTGFPFIDAIMIKLRKEGWIHHLARHAVACFLTRGDLWISWEEGLKVFENLLIDHDWSLNAGNWMWLSASAFFHAYFRVYSPIAFGKKTDPNGDFIRKYLPVLKRFPAKYIYDPWNSPLSVQQAAGCVIGKDYPKPIVDHSKAVTKNLARMKQAREAKYGSKQAANVKKSPPKRKRSSEKTNGKVRKITDFTKS